MAKTIKIEPTWRGVLHLLLATYKDGNDKGRGMALAELTRMAEAADRWNAANPPENEKEGNQ